jgi:hypothetical protein
MFAQSSDINRHLRVHSGERPFSCEVCKKRFTQRSVLKIHLRMHNGERRFSCNVCKKQFTRHSNLNRHLRSHSGGWRFAFVSYMKTLTGCSYLNPFLDHTVENNYFSKCRNSSLKVEIQASLSEYAMRDDHFAQCVQEIGHPVRQSES